MKKQIIRLLLCVAFCLVLLPSTAHAAEHTHCVCGAEHTEIGDHTAEELITFTAWSDTTSLPSSKGNYYLTADVTLSAAWNPVDGTVLCLNGHTITGADGKDVISIPRNSSFTLTDCAETSGKITHAEGATGCGVSNQGTFYMYGGSISGNARLGVENDGTFNMYGGSISGNTEIGVDNFVTFNLYGGSISGNESGLYTGTAFTMYGGSISGNTSGGVFNFDTFNLYGGSITNNSTSNENGGGVYNEGTFTMTDGTISGNTVESTGSKDACGGGVYNNGGTFTMSGGTISGNTVKSTGSKDACGGGVYNNGDTFTMSGGTISGNTVKSTGSGIVYGGGVYNAGTFTLTDGSITDNIAGSADSNGAYGGGVYNNGTFNLSGNAEITGNTGCLDRNNIFLESEHPIIIPEGSSFTGSVGISSKDIPTEGNHITVVTNGVAYANCFFSDSAAYALAYVFYSDNANDLMLTVATEHVHCVCGAEHMDIGDHTAKEPILFVAWDETDDLPDLGCYYLTVDVTLSHPWSFSYDVVLCLNGHTITGPKNDPVIRLSSYLQDDDSLTLTDCAETPGKITHADSEWGPGVDTNGGTFTMYGGSIVGNTYGDGAGIKNDGTFIMYGGSITGNTEKSDDSGGAGVKNSGTFIMYGGSIADNTADALGGGVRNDKEATFNMHGGSITNNVAVGSTKMGYGGGVLNYGTFNMYDGSISGNSASYSGCGVYNGGTFTMAEGTISGNTKEGVTNSGTFTMTGGRISESEKGVVCGGTSRIQGGIIRNNAVGCHIFRSGFTTMSGGTFFGNKTGVWNYGTFTMTGGTIYCSNEENIENHGTFTNEGGTVIEGHTFTTYVADGKGLEIAQCDRGCGSTDARVAEDQTACVTMDMSTQGSKAERAASAALLQQISEKQLLLRLESELATLTFDPQAIESVLDANADCNTITFTVEDTTPTDAVGKLTYDISLSVDGTVQNGVDFGTGTVTVCIPLDRLSLTDGQTVKVWYVNGEERTDMNGTVEDGKVSFTTSHFSVYEVEAVDLTAETDGFTLTLDDRTKGNAATSLVAGQAYRPGDTFTVTCEYACVVAFSLDGGETYTELSCIAVEGEENTYRFAIPEDVNADFLIGIILRGDANGNGKVAANDATRIQRYLATGVTGNNTLDALELLAADANGNGKVAANDATRIQRYLASGYTGNNTLDWNLTK